MTPPRPPRPRPPRLHAPSDPLRRRPLRRRLTRRIASRRLRIAAAISLLVHIVIGVLLLVTIRRERKDELLPPPATVTMLFDRGRRSGPTEPEPQPNTMASPAPPAPEIPPSVEAPSPVPPVNQAPTSIPPLPPPVEVPSPVPPEPEPAQPPPAPPQSAPAPPPPPVEQNPEAEPMPSPPPLAPKPPVTSPPLPPPIKHAAPAKPPDFPSPMNYSFGAPVPRSRPQSTRHPPGAMDFSVGPAKPGPANNTPFADIDGDKAGPDWRNALSRWVSEHAYYPPQARREGEEGNAKVHVVVMPSGRVTSVELTGRSGSMWLDLALQALFRDARIPPLPSGTREPIDFTFTMHYILIRR